MSKIRYGVAMSLDGYIAGPNGEADWIVMDPEIDFAGLWAEFDTFLMGRRTYEAGILRLGKTAMHEKKVVVLSRTLKAEEHPDVLILRELDNQRIQTLRAQSGKDIWLMGGGETFRSLLEMNEVDGVEVTVIPVLLGAGVKMNESGFGSVRMKLTGHRIYSSGIVSLKYEIVGL